MNSSGHNLLIKFQRMSSDRYGVLDSNLMSNIVFLNNIKYLFTVAQIKRTNRDLANQMLFMNNMHVSEKFVVAVVFFFVFVRWAFNSMPYSNNVSTFSVPLNRNWLFRILSSALLLLLLLCCHSHQPHRLKCISLLFFIIKHIKIIIKLKIKNLRRIQHSDVVG